MQLGVSFAESSSSFVPECQTLYRLIARLRESRILANDFMITICYHFIGGIAS